MELGKAAANAFAEDGKMSGNAKSICSARRKNACQPMGE